MTPSPFTLAILRALQGKHVYGGTVAVIARRRAANKVARRLRRINRGRS